jgi:general secretion pathway protein A
MYLPHFGLESNPFSLTPDPRFLFLTAKHREALAALLFAVTERKGFMVMTGEAGTGKTTLVRKLLLSIPVSCAQFSVVVNPALTRSEFLEHILMDFGQRDIPSSKALRLALFQKLLLRAHAEGKTSVLVIDEAHLLTGELIEEVRLLSNIETAEQKLLQIILVGQSELNNVLSLESLRQMKQRVAIKMHINPLAESEIKRYIQTRWNRACAKYSLPFSEDAVALIADSSEGVPRVINVICDAALVNAYGTGTRVIGVVQIQEVLEDLGIAAAKYKSLTTGADTSVLPDSGPNHIDRIPDRPVSALNPLDRSLKNKPKDPKVWKIGNWFRTAHN